jgi:membrane protein DedA with SNARE-associated domain
MVERGERAYARWSRFAVFFTPAIVSGTANMKHAQFVVWNLLASLGFAVSVAASADGLGRIFTGHDSAKDIATLVVGLAVGALVAVLSVSLHRHRSAAEGTPG